LKRITTQKQLPEWFSLQKYQVFKTMSDQQLIEQVSVRRDMYRTEILAYLNVKNNDLYKQLADDDRKDFHLENTDPFFNSIVNSKPDLSELIKLFSLGITDSNDVQEYNLTSVEGIHPLSFSDVIGLQACYSRVPSLDSGWTHPRNDNVDHSKQKQSIDYWREINEKPLWFMPERGINININLRDLKDTQILDELKTLLPLWREKLGKEEPRGLKPRVDDYQKMKDYELFAYFDLQVWAEINEINITDHLLANCLYELGEYTVKSAEWGENHVKQTLKPFYQKVFNPLYKPYKSR
jgi:hypothetical protein